MHANSHPVTSAQVGIHPHLSTLLARHAASPFLKPIADYNRLAFDASMTAWQAAGQAPLILDSGCGVGLSTLNLACLFPDHFVIGIDQSADRLARNTSWPSVPPSNFILQRSDLVDFWRLMLAADIHPVRHYVLYPNPWPKIGQLARRWHGHAVFPSMLALGGALECRSNWQTYIEEFAAALRQLRPLLHDEIVVDQYQTSTPITPFEQKYLASGHLLWRCRAQLK